MDMNENEVNDSPEEDTAEESAVFNTTDGWKVRIEFCKVASYVGKNSKTTITYGYYDNSKTYILDIDFKEFDKLYMDWKESGDNAKLSYY